MADKKTLTTKEQARAIFGVAKLSFKVAPGPVLFKLGGAVIDAVLPLITVYFAARTTTELAAAYQGDSAAGEKAILFVLVTAVLGLIQLVWQSIDNYIQAKMRYVIEAAVSDRMYTHFLALEFWRYDDKDTADIFDRAIKFSQFFAWVFDRIASIIAQIIAAISALVALLFFEPLLALIILTAITPGVFIQFKLSRKQIKHWNENVEVRRAQSMLEWHLGQPRLISELRLYGMVDFLLKHRRKLRDTDEQERVNFEKTFIPLRLASDALEALVELGALLWITLQIIHRNQPIGQFVFVQQIVSRAIQSSSSLISTVAQIDEDIANLFDYEEFMQLPVMSTDGVELTKPPKTIEFKNVTFTYPNGKNPVLNDVSFKINFGEDIAIVGENGAGKTTLVKLLTGLYSPTSGEILLDGIHLSKFNITSWHKQLGVLQQEFIRYEFATAADNVRFGAVHEKHSEDRLNEALTQAEAKKFVSKLPLGKDSYVNNWMEDNKGNKGVALSGGQWQRLALARDFYRKAPIIILDEPTSAIDALAEARIFTRLFKDDNRTVIAISHRLSTIKKADQILMFENGKLVELGTHKELLDKNGHYVRMFKSQL